MDSAASRGSIRISSPIADEVFTELTRLRAAGVPCCLATVVRVEAPTSAKPGDKAVIMADGAMVGWIGGSCSESSIRREAQFALTEGTPRVVRIEPSQDRPAPTRFDVQPAADDGVPGTLPGGEVVLQTTCPSGGTLEIFLEPQLARPQLAVIGRSPVAKTLIRLAAIVGFRTCAIHPGAREDDFPAVDRLVPGLDLSSAGIASDSWVVVATMGHYDEEALEAVLSTSASYVGLIASRRRRNAVVQSLRKGGWPGDTLAGIVNPAGRALADTPEEIALSVLADIVDRRSRRKTRLQPATAPPPATFATDPVCGMAVEIATARFSTGDTYFCGPGCLEAFQTDPARYHAQP